MGDTDTQSVVAQGASAPVGLPGTDAHPGVRGRTDLELGSQGSERSKRRGLSEKSGCRAELQGTARPG